MSDFNPKVAALAEFKRRTVLSKTKLRLQSSVLDEAHQHWWWCRDEALRVIRRQFVESRNHCVIDGFIGKEAFANVASEVKQAQDTGLLDIEGTLTFGGRVESTRADTLGWFDCSSQSAPPHAGACGFEGGSSVAWPHLKHLLERMETIVAELGSLSGGGGPFESTADLAIDEMVGNALKQCRARSRCMVTRYAGKHDESSRYTKHIDNGDSNGRRITAIYYLNEGWRRHHGGALRLYDNVGDDVPFVDVEPIADRLVLFLSDAHTPHEVMPTHQDRFAVTCWFLDPNERAEAKKRGGLEAL